MKLYNQGYVVQGKYKNIYTSELSNYYGVEKYFSWPLDNDDSSESKYLNKLLWENWFCYQNQLETVPSIEFLRAYVQQCDARSIPTTILKLEAAVPTTFSVDELPIQEIIGFDCIVGVHLSYLNIASSYMMVHFPLSYSKINSYGLFYNWEDAQSYIKEYEQLRNSGENLEYGLNPLPVRLSTITDI